MSTFTLTFKMDNAAFDDDVTLEVEAILDRAKLSFRKVWGENASYDLQVPVFDTNGNNVGMWRTTSEIGVEAEES